MMPRFDLLLYGAVPAVLGAFGIVFLKRAGRHFTGFSPQSLMAGVQKAASTADIWIGIALYVLAFAWVVVIISRVEVSRFYPVAVGLNIVFVTVGGLVLLHEPMTLPKVAGIALVVLGVFLVSS
jgi:multidrug transporter EmrE-like cation transporter